MSRPGFELDESPQNAARAGEQVGAYTIDRLLGRGGMGEVWLASRSDGRFEAQRAIKFLAGAPAQAKVAQRFRHEAALLARLGHPHIARLFDAGTTTDDRPFLVLEYVDGTHIDEYCELNQLSVRARVRLFLDAVAAVAHAHSQLVVHRDLKPSNVLVTRDGAIKLLDFGIGRLLSEEPAFNDDTSTWVEEIAVTPEYAAPEQLSGGAPSTATDVYQLGMLLYVLLARAHPLSSFGSRAERIKAALNGELPRASQIAAHALRKHLRGDLDAILGKALRPDPADRYQTAAALRDDLDRHLNREPVSARRGTHLYGIRKFIARHRLATGASLVACLGLCGMLIFAREQARRAANERDGALALVARNEAVTEFLGALITDAAGAEKPVTVTEMLARSEQLAMASTRDNPENRAAVLRMVAERYGALGDYASATRILENGLSLLTDSRDHALRSELTCLRAASISEQGQSAAAARTIERELESLQSEPWVAAYCLLYRANIAAELQQAEPALRYAQQALERLHSAPRAITADEALFLDAVGVGYYLGGRVRDADRYYQQAVRKYAEVGREASANGIAVRNNWGFVVAGAGAPKRALQIHERTLALIAARTQGETPPSFLVGNRARALEEIGRYQEARAVFEQELQIAEQRHNTSAQAHALTGLVSTSQELHDRSAAIGFLERFTKLVDESIPVGSTAWRRHALAKAKLEMDAGKFAAARAGFEQALGNPNTALGLAARLGMTEAELRAGDAAGAAENAQLALKVATIMQGDSPYSNFTGLSWLALGRAQLQLGHHALALHSFENAELQLSNTVDGTHPALADARELRSAARLALPAPHG